MIPDQQKNFNAAAGMGGEEAGVLCKNITQQRRPAARKSGNKMKCSH
jgi:hypothetical protein